MSKDKAINILNDANLKEKGEAFWRQKIKFFSSSYKRWVITILINKKVDKDC